MVIQRVGRKPSRCRTAPVEEGVSQHLEQVAEIVLVADPPWFREYAGKGLLHEVLRIDSRAGQRPCSAEQAIDVIAQGAGVERPVGGRPV
jgi:hypothetical protein